MQNPLSYAVNYIKQRIPMEILRRVYMDKCCHSRITAESLDDRIRSQIIFPIVVVDSNLVGGTEDLIPLDGLDRETIDPYTAIWTIPKSVTNGRSIVSALSVSYSGAMGTMGIQTMMPNMGLMQRAGMQMFQSRGPLPIIATANVTLVGENQVFVQDISTLPTNVMLRCWLDNPEDFNHLNPAIYRDFGKLCLFAAKMDIYNKMIVKMNAGELMFGQELGSIRDIITSYSDAEENYNTFIEEVWYTKMVSADHEAQKTLLKLQLGGGF